MNFNDIGYTFRTFTIPAYMLGNLQAYIQTGRPVGGFLTAVLRNDLREAVGRADDHNIANLPAYIAYLHNKAPMGCWGSTENVKHWKEIGGLDGIKKEAA